MPKPPPEPPPPPPEPKVVQVSCVSWKSMNFQLEVQLPYMSIAELEEIIKKRHGDPIENLVLYKDDPRDKANKLESASEGKLDKVGTNVFYDYYPPLDPFNNRPTAHEAYSTNPLLKSSCTEEYEGQVIKGVVYWKEDGFWKNTTPCEVKPSILPWSKTAEYDPFTARIKAAEAKAEADRIAAIEAEAARVKAEEEARQEALRQERIAKKKAIKEEKKRVAAELKAAEEAAAEAERQRLAEEAEAERLRLAEEAAARGEEPPPPPAPKIEMPTVPIPPRVKGASVPAFLGPTSKEYFGLTKATKDMPLVMVPKDMLLAEIKEKGKISDVYIFKAEIEKYDGADGEICFCMDRDEVYSDEGFIACFKEAEKLNFQASLAQGNGIPPPM